MNLINLSILKNCLSSIKNNLNYNDLKNKPVINDIEILGNLSLSDLGIYSKEEINEFLELIPRFNIEIVESLPTENISNTTIYLILSDNEIPNMFTEYIYINNNWEKIGEQDLDLSDYIKTVNGITPDDNGNVDIPQLTAGNGIKIENNVISLNLPIYSGGVIE